MNDNDLYPVLEGKDLLGNRSPGEGYLIPRQIRLPDLYGRYQKYCLRYRVRIDCSVLAQSEAEVDVWDPATLTWKPLARVFVKHEFYMTEGPNLDPMSMTNFELAKPVTAAPTEDDVDMVACSWTKIYRCLGHAARKILATT